MDFNLNKSLEILERTPRVLQNMLSGISEEWVICNEGPETWSAFDIVGHLIHGEKADWMQRIEIILGDGDKKFTPFDRFAQFRESKGKTMQQLLNEFSELRNKNVAALRLIRIDEDNLHKTGIHPHFGAVTLKQLLSTWTVHDLAHIAQISRVMAKQYKQEVGPWVEFISLLQK